MEKNIVTIDRDFDDTTIVGVLNLEKHKPNLRIAFGHLGVVEIEWYAKKNLLNRFKYWMLCHFFPFQIISWSNKEVKE